MAGPLRFGLVGTGPWARIAHAPALASAQDVEFAAVWGRNQAAAADLATAFGVTAHSDLGAFLDSVDAVAFAVPPDAQFPIAVRAAAAGKHLLLEKPLALTGPDADALVDAVASAGVASVVFFTGRFLPEVRDCLAAVTGTGGWAGGCAAWLGSAMDPASPFHTPWRQVHGGLWDVGPHLVSLLWASLGPVRSVAAQAGLGDVTHLILRHESGATSSVTVTLAVPAERAEYAELFVWGPAGRVNVPVAIDDPVPPLRVALAELAANAAAGQTAHPCDARFGRDVTAVLADAQRQIAAGLPASAPVCAIMNP